MVRDHQDEGTRIPVEASPTIEAIYRAQWASLVRLAMAMSGDRGKAEDIVHDVFVRFATRPFPLDPSSYLRAMVINAARDHHRRIRLERRVVHAAPSPVLIPEVDEIIGILQKLPDRQRLALALRYYADMDVQQISEALGCPMGTVKSLIHRGLETLRMELNT
jgi:RNA polymerase sigma factor (sigma-70 family)